MRAQSSSSLTPRSIAASISSYRSSDGRLEPLSSSSVSSAARAIDVELARAPRLHPACLNVRPIAIASPTLCMCVESEPSAPGNFSNANRGHLTTT